MKKASDNCVAIVKEFEGLRLKKYICPAGFDTIGYGHLIKSDEISIENITEDEAHRLLIKDLEIAEMAINRLVNVELNQNQFDALCSFIFNIGSGNFQASTLRQKINRSEFESASIEFDRWVFSEGKKLSGLVARRLKERELWEKK